MTDEIMSSGPTKIKDLEAEINAANNPGLVKPDEQPNGNTIFHLYSNGKITYQKGGWAYGQRSEFTSEYCIETPNMFGFQFVNPSKYGLSYVIVDEETAIRFRTRIAELCVREK